LKPGFFDGLTFWFRGWGVLLRDRWLILFALFPFVFALSIAGYTFTHIFALLPVWATGFVSWFLTPDSWWFNLVYYPFWLVSAVLIFISAIAVAYFGHALISIPFYAQLADRTLSKFGAKKSEPFQLKHWLRNSLRMLRVGLMKTMLFIFLALTLFILSFIPLVNIAAMFGTLMILAFDLMDYSLESLQYGFRRRVGFATGNKRMWAGMACALGLTLFIPGLTLVIAPGAVVGAALLVKESLAHGS